MDDHARALRRFGALPRRALAARNRRGLGALPGLAGLAVLAVLAAGCGSPAAPVAGQGTGSTPASSGASGPSGTHGLVTPPATPGNQAGSQAGEPTATGSRSGVVGGALFGGDVPLVHDESALGRRLAIVRTYYRIGQVFPNARDRQLMAAGSTLLVSLDTVPGRGPSYASIVAGTYDRAIRTFLGQVQSAAVRYRLGAIYICFEHEANSPKHSASLGSPSEFVRAWDHVHALAASAHLDWNTGGRMHWVWILTAEAFRSTPWASRVGPPSAYWPGDDAVDVVAADGYNAAGCRQAKPGTNLVAGGSQVSSPALLFGGVVAFARAHGGLPVFIAEWGSVPYASSGVQPEYIDQMRSYVTGNREIAAALYWNGHGNGNGCDYQLDAHSSSLSALAVMGRSAGLQGRIVPVP
jgi:hypothetical protein